MQGARARWSGEKKARRWGRALKSMMVGVFKEDDAKLRRPG
jgi:hypothetical protein